LWRCLLLLSDSHEEENFLGPFAFAACLQVSDSELLQELMWSDPSDGAPGFQPSVRGLSPGCVAFGPDIVQQFCERNGIDHIVRGHEYKMKGWEFFADGRLITIFSATNYCGMVHNDGAILHVIDMGTNWRILPKFIDEDQSAHSSSPGSSRWAVDASRPPTPVKEPRCYVAGGDAAPERDETDSEVEGGHDAGDGDDDGDDAVDGDTGMVDPFASSSSSSSSSAAATTDKIGFGFGRRNRRRTRRRVTLPPVATVPDEFLDGEFSTAHVVIPDPLAETTPAAAVSVSEAEAAAATPTMSGSASFGVLPPSR
jgi:hypothetical protein